MSHKHNHWMPNRPGEPPAGAQAIPDPELTKAAQASPVATIQPKGETRHGIRVLHNWPERVDTKQVQVGVRVVNRYFEIDPMTGAEKGEFLWGPDIDVGCEWVPLESEAPQVA